MFVKSGSSMPTKQNGNQSENRIQLSVWAFLFHLSGKNTPKELIKRLYASCTPTLGLHPRAVSFSTERGKTTPWVSLYSRGTSWGISKTNLILFEARRFIIISAVCFIVIHVSGLAALYASPAHPLSKIIKIAETASLVYKIGRATEPSVLRIMSFFLMTQRAK